jgi:hypothetical protein
MYKNHYNPKDGKSYTWAPYYERLPSLVHIEVEVKVKLTA